MDKAFMVSLLMGATSIAVESLSFSKKNFLLVLVERLPQGFPEILAKEESRATQIGHSDFFSGYK